MATAGILFTMKFMVNKFDRSYAKYRSLIDVGNVRSNVSNRPRQRVRYFDAIARSSSRTIDRTRRNIPATRLIGNRHTYLHAQFKISCSHLEFSLDFARSTFSNDRRYSSRSPQLFLFLGNFRCHDFPEEIRSRED